MNTLIEINPSVCAGKPVFRGTRIPVTVVLDQLAADESWDALLRSYPELRREHLQAAISYARDCVAMTEVTELVA